MQLTKPAAEIYVADGLATEPALARTTMMGISAHQDDLEIMAHHGILSCFGNSEQWFAGVVVTNGSGSPRDDIYAAYSDEEMMKVRRLEQKKAAFVGEYGSMAMLDFTSGEVKDAANATVKDELKALIAAARPRIIYTHNPADKHDTHVGVLLRTIQALRELPAEMQPEKVYACEVWRALDWVNDEEKVVFDVSAHENLAAALLGVFDSQICGGKRYDLASMGRRRANATYFASHGVDQAEAMSFGIDLTPLIKDPDMDIAQFTLGYISRFAADVADRLTRVG